MTDPNPSRAEEPGAAGMQAWGFRTELPYSSPASDPHRDIQAIRSRWHGPGDPPTASRAAVGASERGLGIAAVLAMAVGAAGPWASALGLVSKNGLSGDGQVVIALAVVAVIAGWSYLGRQGRGALVALLLCGLLSSATTVYDYQDVVTASKYVSVEWGLLLAMAGSLALTGVAVHGLRTRR